MGPRSVRKDYKTVGPMVRFRARVKMLGGCAIWTGARTDGYGTFRVNGRETRVHRWAYETFVGPIPEGKEIDHLCRERACAGVTADGVVLGHLEAVTHRENLRRGLIVGGARQRAKTRCPRGHPYDEQNTYVWKGGRNCRVCHRDRNRQYQARRRARCA